MLRKLFATLLLVLLCGGAASAEIVGRHTVFNMSEQDISLVRAVHPNDFYVGIDLKDISLKFYDSLNTMLLALAKGEVDSITVPRAVGRYILENNSDFELKAFNWWKLDDSAFLSFGCLQENAELMKKINEVVAAMKQDGTLAILEKTYIENYADSSFPTVKLEKFDDAQTITVALTGDLPPIDYVDAAGVPAGFNVAVLKELGRRLHMNINTIQVDTGARLTVKSQTKFLWKEQIVFFSLSHIIIGTSNALLAGSKDRIYVPLTLHEGEFFCL